jgi:iron complex transport system substrate-binding protein
MLAACSNGDDEATPSATATTVLGSPTTADPADSPASWIVSHKYGETEITSIERVITLGYVDHDAVLALGVIPVAIGADEYSADQPHGVWPWAQDELGAGTPEILPPFELDFERIAALQPDLILAVYAGITQEEYQKLSSIAPTVAQSGDHDDYTTPWDEMTLAIGQALNKESEARELIAEVENHFDEARAEHPEFEGKTAIYAGLLATGNYYAEGVSSRVAILTSLGFDVPDDIEAAGFYTEISQEQIQRFDQDVLLWELGDPASRTEIESNPLYSQLDVEKEGRDIFVVDRTLAGGLALISVLSLPYVIDELVPRLAAAVDGNPATLVAD